jgi:hypothetical protein
VNQRRNNSWIHKKLSAANHERLVKKTFEGICEVILGQEMMDRPDVNCAANQLRRGIYQQVSHEIRIIEERFSCTARI